MLVSRPAARNPAAAAAIATTTRTERTRGIFIVSLHRVGATSSPGPVSHAAVAVDALRRLALAVAAAQDVVDEVLVAALAVALEDARVARRDLDRLVEVLEREALRVAIAVVRLRQVLGDRVVGEMAVDAAGRAVVRPLGPRGVLVVHDVAVRAGARVGREVAEALAVAERERADSRRRADEEGDHSPQREEPTHRVLARREPRHGHLSGAGRQNTSGTSSWTIPKWRRDMGASSARA